MSIPYAEVIGDPIAHSKSPLIHGFWLAKLGLEAEYRKTHVRAGGVAAFLHQREKDPDWRGCNVTAPHKQIAMELLWESTSLHGGAHAVGAVNTIVQQAPARSGRGSHGGVIGYNTDIIGIAEPLGAIPPPILEEVKRAENGNLNIQIIGAGGAARAAADGADLAGYTGRHFFYNRTAEKAVETSMAVRGSKRGAFRLDELGPFPTLPGKPYPDRYLVMNMTPMGMAGKPPVPIDLSAYPSDTIVFDAVYTPLETPLLAQARALGMRTIDGLQMLVGQAAVAFALFFGQPAPREHDAELRALLTA